MTHLNSSGNDKKFHDAALNSITVINIILKLLIK